MAAIEALRLPGENARQDGWVGAVPLESHVAVVAGDHLKVSSDILEGTVGAAQLLGVGRKPSLQTGAPRRLRDRRSSLQCEFIGCDENSQKSTFSILPRGEHRALKCGC